MTASDGVGRWRTSTFSAQGQDCVEVKVARVVGVRDTKDRDGGQLSVRGPAWQALIASVTRG